MVDFAKKEDKQQIRALWEMCFDDSKQFIDWFFEYRFIPEYTVCYKQDGMVISAMQAVPARMLVRKQSLPCAIVAGVSTHKQHQGKGLMRKIFTFFLNEMREKGIVLAPHTPANLTTFYKLGHFPVTDTRYMSFAHKDVLASDVYEVDLHKDVCAIFDCYSRNSKKYSGIIERSLADFRFKCEDYASDGARCFAHIVDEKVISYAIYYDNKKQLYVEEYFGQGSEAIKKLMSIKDVKVKMPVDYDIDIDCVKNEAAPQGVAGLVNAQELLRLVGRNEKYAVEIEDSVVLSNAGAYDFCGRKTDIAPALKISAGRLTQWLCGYTSLAEIEEITIYDGQAVKTLDDMFPKQPCYIVDMY